MKARRKRDGQRSNDELKDEEREGQAEIIMINIISLQVISGVRILTGFLFAHRPYGVEGYGGKDVGSDQTYRLGAQIEKRMWMVSLYLPLSFSSVARIR